MCVYIKVHMLILGVGSENVMYKKNTGNSSADNVLYSWRVISYHILISPLLTP